MTLQSGEPLAMERLPVGRILDRAVYLALKQRTFLCAVAFAAIAPAFLVSHVRAAHANSAVITGHVHAFGSSAATQAAHAALVQNQSNHAMITFLFIILLEVACCPIKLIMMKTLFCNHFDFAIAKRRTVESSLRSGSIALVRQFAIILGFFVPFVLVISVIVLTVSFILLVGASLSFDSLKNVLRPQAFDALRDTVVALGSALLLSVTIAVILPVMGLFNMATWSLYFEKKSFGATFRNLRRWSCNRTILKRVFVLGFVKSALFLFSCVILFAQFKFFKHIHLEWFGQTVNLLASIPYLIIQMAFTTIFFIDFRQRFQGFTRDAAIAECIPCADGAISADPNTALALRLT